MKKICLLAILLFNSMAFAAKAQFPADLLDNMNKVPKSWIDDDKSEKGAKFLPTDVYPELYDLGELLYSAGIIKIEGLNKHKCRVKELINIEKIRAANTVAGIEECYKNFTKSFSKDGCHKDLTFEDYFPKVSNSSIFKMRFKCEGDIPSIMIVPKEFASGYNSNAQKRLYQSLYWQLVKRIVNENKNDTQLIANEYELATVKQCPTSLLKLPFANYEATNSCTMSGQACTKHEDCCSQQCMLGRDQTSGICQQEMSCYRLIEKGNDCKQLNNGKFNPYCKNKEMLYALDPVNNPAPLPGEKTVSCIEINGNTSGIGECTVNGESPTDALPCCSDKVGSNGKCIESNKCEFCYEGGKVVPDSEKCCPGYYKSQKNDAGKQRCIQDFPPLQTSVDKAKNKSILSLILANLSYSTFANEQELTQGGDGGGGGGGSTGSGSNSGGGTNQSGSGQGGTNTGSGATQGDGDSMQSSLSEEDRKKFADARAACFKINNDQEALDACLSQVSKDEAKAISDNLNDPSKNSEMISRKDYIKRFNRAVIIEKKGSDFKNCEFHSYNDNWNSGSDTFRNAELVLRGFEYIYSGKGTRDFWINKNGRSMFERAQSVAKELRKNRKALINAYKEADEEMTKRCKELFSGQKWGNVDGQNPETGASLTVEEKMEQMSDVDAGASGQKYTQLMVDFLNLRRDALMEYFAANAKAEEGSEALMEQLSEEVNETEWEQSWSHRPHQSRKGVFLYKFTTKTPTWFLSFLTFLVSAAFMIAGALLAPFTGGASMMMAFIIVVAINSGGGNNFSGPKAQEYIAKVVNDSMYEDRERKIVDDKYHHRTPFPWFYKYRYYNRYYLGPVFDATKPGSKMNEGIANAQPDEKCYVHASSRMCLRNVHILKHKYPNEAVDKIRFLVDMKFPEFLRANLYEEDSKLQQMINQSYAQGISLLKTTRPGGKKTEQWKNIKFLMQKKYTDRFTPKDGKWSPKEFDATLQKEFKRAVKEYAMCTDLVACGAKYAEVGDYGFGYLISTEEDATAFANYVYEHHFLWPSFSRVNKMSYPTVAQSSYFQSIAYYIRVVGSLASTKAGDFGTLSSKYQEHLENLDGEYDKGAGASQGRSKNAKYSKEFNNKFALLDFKTGQGVDAFVGKGGKPIIPKGFNAAEKTAFSAGVSKAIRAKKLNAKAEHYKKTVGNTARAKIKQKAQGSFLQKFGRPIDNMSESLKQGLDSKPIVAKSVEKKESEKRNIKAAVYTPPKLPSYGAQGYGGGYNGGVSDSSSDSSSTSMKASSDELAKNRMLLDNAKKMQRDLKRDDSDSLFKIVTKAYFRNLDLILEKINPSKVDAKKTKSLEYQRKKDTISNDKKSELKKLLSQ